MVSNDSPEAAFLGLPGDFGEAAEGQAGDKPHHLTDKPVRREFANRRKSLQGEGLQHLLRRAEAHRLGREGQH